MGNKIDYKKEYKALYMPGRKPAVIEVPAMKFIMVEGKGDPNTSEEYKNAIEIIYGLSFGIKMSKMNGARPEGYFEYVVPPLEGLWWSAEEDFDFRYIQDKSGFCWYSIIRQPDFVTEEVYERAVEQLRNKKSHIDFSKTRFVTWEEGLCVQVMHIGPYDEEPATINMLYEFMEENGFESGINKERLHHEIYLGDPRKTKPENLKTVIRHPVKKSSRD